ncbi:MAG: transposase [Actinobacteria bacterium]|nr:transposase [Actinomycetota bacterium]
MYKKTESSPAAVAVIQTFGDYLSFNPHMHILAADGCFSEDGFFYGYDLFLVYLKSSYISCSNIMSSNAF